MNSPFIYGSTVYSKAFTNRKKEKEKLYHNFKSLINTSIISPRRWGKTSLVEHVCRQINQDEKKYRAIMIDLFSVNSEQELLSLIAQKTLKATSSKWDEIVQTSKSVFEKIVPKVSMSLGPGEITIEFDDKEIIKHRSELLNLTEKLAKAKNIKLIICIDEFQNIRNYPNADQLEKAMRAHWQRHKHVCYCLYGSKRHMMTEIFNNPSRAFYRFGDIIMLQKINEKEWIKFITKSFARTKKTISDDQAAQICQNMKNHSWYVQQLAHYIWQRTKRKVSQTEIDGAIQEIQYAQQPFFQQIVENLSATQINLIKAIAGGATQLTATATMQDYKLGTPNNVSKNYKTLNEKDIIDKYGDTYIFLDPVFEMLFSSYYTI